MEIPKEIKFIIATLEEKGFEAYAVGGCVRDLLLGREPSDWDITTNAAPEQIQEIFPDSFYANAFGTVTVKTGSDNESLSEVEVTPFRGESKYTDKRHPDKVVWVKKLEDDLKRRDFTANAIALATINKQQLTINIIDLFNGQEDIQNKIIRTVGEPEERFKEDALRLMRAVRFAIQLDFKIEEKTRQAIIDNAGWLRAIAKERIKDEFIKIIMTPRAGEGVELLRELGLLQYIMPELEEGWGVTQNKHHRYTVFDHSLKALAYAAEQNYDLQTRLAALLHDIGKARTKLGEGPDCHFYGHDVVSAKMAGQIMERLRFPRLIIIKVMKLIRAHMFIYNSNPEQGAVTSDSAVRRIIRRVGEENIWDLARLRLADRAGSGVKKIEKFDNRHFKFRVERLLKEPLSVKMLTVNGDDVMKKLKIPAGPKIGWFLSALLQDVLDDPQKNNQEYLFGRLEELDKLKEKELENLSDESKKEIGLYEEQETGKIKEKYWVHGNKKTL